MGGSFHDLNINISYVERLNEGGEIFSSIEYICLYPNWDCNVWEVELSYQGKTLKPFQLYTTVELEELDSNDVLMTIFDKDYRYMNKPQFKINNEYNDFFNEYGEFYGGNEEVELVLENLYRSGSYAAGLLYKLMGDNDFYALRDFLGYR